MQGGQIQPGEGHRPVGVQSQLDGNFSSNYPGSKNVRVADHIHYGECDEDCGPGCMHTEIAD